MIKRCFYCNSIWVFWNWLHQTKKEINRLNPHRPCKRDHWGHECLHCNACLITDYKIRNGIPHWILKIFHKNINDKDKLPFTVLEEGE